MAESHDPEYYLTAFIMISILVFAVFGNIFTIIATYKFNSLHTRTHFLILNLAVSDLFVALLAGPVRLVQMVDSVWSNKVGNCRVVICLTLFFCNASVLNLTLISIDRALSIVAPLKYNHYSSHWRLFAQIAISWIIAIIISFLPFFGFGWRNNGKDSRDSSVDVCRYLAVLDKDYVLLVFGFTVFGPFLIMTISYAYIFRTAVGHLKRISAIEVSIRRTTVECKSKGTHGTDSTTTEPSNETKVPSYRTYLFKKELKAAKMVAIVIGLFILCVVPIVIVDIIEIARGPNTLPTWFITIAVCLAYVNPAVNILAYATASSEYRTAYKKLLKALIFCKARAS